MRVTGPVDTLTRATLKIIVSANGCTDPPRPPIPAMSASGWSAPYESDDTAGAGGLSSTGAKSP